MSRLRELKLAIFVFIYFELFFFSLMSAVEVIETSPSAFSIKKFPLIFSIIFYISKNNKLFDSPIVSRITLYHCLWLFIFLIQNQDSVDFGCSRSTESVVLLISGPNKNLLQLPSSEFQITQTVSSSSFFKIN